MSDGLRDRTELHDRGRTGGRVHALFGANVGGGLWLEQSSPPVVVTEGATTSGVVLRLGAGAIDISVTNGPTGVMGASIQPCLQGVPEAPNGEICTGTTSTDPSGHAVLPALPDGTYSVKVNANGYAMTVATGVVINGGSTPHVDVTLSPAATVTGTVTGNLGTGAAVAACAAPTDPNPAWTGPGTNPCGAAAGTFALVNPTTGVSQCRLWRRAPTGSVRMRWSAGSSPDR